MGGQRNSFALNVGGQRIHYNHYSLDGVENTDLNFNSYLLLPSVDALQEFNVVAGLFDAEYGRAIAQINASTKSGTNQFHGTVFEFARNSALDAKNYFDRDDRPIPPFRRNQYGATVGGPVIIPRVIDGTNRLFFMFNWEGLRENKSLTSTPSVPLTAWREGDFSNLRDASGNLIPIYDPATRVFDAAGNVIQAPTAFPGNRIPANRIHPVSRQLTEYYPLPLQEVTGANYVNDEARLVNADQYTYRLDFTQNSNASWFFRHSISHELGYDPFAIPDMGINTDTDVHQAALGYTRTFGSNRLNDLRLGFSKLYNGHISPRANVDNVVGRLGINLPNDNPLYWGVPNIGITGLSGIGEESDAPFINDDQTFQIVDNFTWTVSKHSFKFGGELRHVVYDQIGGVVTRGRWAFDGRYTQNPLLPAAQRGGAAFADFLLGHFNRSEGQVGAPVANFRSNYFALYAQDSWRVSQNLTVNYGLRWEYDQPFVDENDAIVNIDFDWANTYEPVFVRTGTGDPYEGDPAFRLAPDVQYVRDGRFGRGAYRSDYNDFAPRLGIAWSIDPKTVLRTGGGMYYVRDIGNAVFDTVRNAPFTIRRDEPAETFRPNLSFEQPFARTGAPTFILANQYDEPSTYIMQWSLGVQRELSGSMSLDATYFGSAGVHLRRLMSYNNPEPSQLANSNLARPFPKFGSIQVMSAPGHSSYHALYLKLQRRFSRGLSFLSSFSWSEIDRQRQRHPHQRRRLADAVQQLRPRSRTRPLGLRLPPALDDVMAVGSADRRGQALAESQRRARLGARRLADRRHRHASGRLPVHGRMRRRHDPERRRHLLSRSDRHRLAPLRRRAHADALFQHRRVRRSQSRRRSLPLRHRRAQFADRPGHRQHRRLGEQALPVDGIELRGSASGSIQPAEPSDLESAGPHAAHADLRRDQQHADGLAADPVGRETGVLAGGRDGRGDPDRGGSRLHAAARPGREEGCSPGRRAPRTRPGRGTARADAWRRTAAACGPISSADR